MKKIIYPAAFVLIFAAFIYWNFLSSPSGDETIVLFKIESGENVEKIGDQLLNRKLIRSSRIFGMLASARGLDRNIKPGRYKLSGNMNVNEILNAFSNPEEGEISVTIPEGYTIDEIDKRLAEIGLIMAGEFRSEAANYEGYLFPDTYFVFKFNFDPKDLVRKMRANFLKKTAGLEQEIAQSKRTLPEIIIMASIIEKEVKTAGDYSVVAGILWKRLDSDWPLQTDATLLYGKQSRSITSSDLNDDSPYNTRKRLGLPPTPIGNPGLATIRAAASPQESSYWFYLTDDEGDVHYATTNDEHNENRRIYLSN